MFGEVALRPVLSAVCRSAPGLLSDNEKDYTVSALDPLDAWRGLQPKKERAPAPGPRSRKGKGREDDMSEDEDVEEVEDDDEGVWEGKGMMRWCLAENKAGASSSSSSSGQPSDPFAKAGAAKAKETVMVRGTVHGVFAEDLEAWATEENGVDEEDYDDDERELEVHLQLISVRSLPFY